MDGSQGPKLGFDLWNSSEEGNKFKKTDVSDNISLDILTLDLQVKLDKDQGFILHKISYSPVSQSPSSA